MPSDPHYRIHLFDVGQPYAGDTARGLTARLMDNRHADQTAVQRLLHYANEKPLPGFAPVKFLGAKQGFRLLGFGDEGIELVRGLAPELALAWSEHAQRPVRQRASQGICALEKKPCEIQFHVRKLVVHKRHTQFARFEADPYGQVAGVISRSLERQLTVLGLPAEVPAVRVLDLQGAFAAKLGHGTAAFQGVRQVTFALPARLTGFWSLGYLSSNGYGLCDANLGNAELVAQKIEEAFHAVGQ
jgi:hypothetical protein